MRARKRQRLNEDGSSAKAASHGKTGHRAKQNVSLDDLNWQPVQAPDHLDDYEGFYGLEEVDGIDLVREEDAGKVTYQLAGTSSTPAKSQSVSVEDVAALSSAARKSGRSQSEGTKAPARVLDSSDNALEKRAEGEPASGEANPQPLVAPSHPSSSFDEDWDGFESSEDETVGTVANDHEDGSEGSDGDSASSFGQQDTSESAFSLLYNHTESESAGVVTSAWHALDLSDPVMTSLSTLHFSSPTSIQRTAIPKIVSGSDVIGKAPTGSGKTLAFGIPIIEAWLARRHKLPQSKRSRKVDGLEGKGEKVERQPIALIIEPTRELARQVNDHLSKLCKHGGSSLDDLSICTLTGGLSIQKQRRLLERADIVVATPGRLWEVVSEGHGVLEALKEISFLVVDEADRLLSRGHFKELEHFLDVLTRRTTASTRVVEVDSTSGAQESTSMKDVPTKQAQRPKPPPHEPTRQVLVFSATFSSDLQHKLARRSFQPSSKASSDPKSRENQDQMAYLLTRLPFQSAPKPTFIDVSPTRSMAAKLREGMLECPGPEKDLYLYALLLHHPPGTRALVFVNSIPAVQRLVPFLSSLKLEAFPLHSHMVQKARLRSVERFSALSSPAANGEPQGKTGPKKTTVLVATDIAARGLDIPAINTVIHYHVPRAADAYIHRSGRTARAEASGTSVLMCAPEEAAGVRRLVGKVHASSKGNQDERKGKELKILGMNATLIGRLKPRAGLAKRISDASISKTKVSSEDKWLNAAAEDLGVDLDDPDVQDTFDKGSRGRGQKRKKREREDAGREKDEVRAWKRELDALLSKRVNVGVSERYITAGGIDIAELLRGGSADFLGTVESLGF